MSQISYPTYTRLSDAMERELLLAAMSNRDNVSLRAVFKQVCTGMRHAASAVASYVAALSDALHEARAKDIRTQCNL